MKHIKKSVLKSCLFSTALSCLIFPSAFAQEATDNSTEEVVTETTTPPVKEAAVVTPEQSQKVSDPLAEGTKVESVSTHAPKNTIKPVPERAAVEYLKGSEWGVGLAAGGTIGGGFSVRKHYDSGFGVHMNFWINHINTTQISNGISLMQTFKRWRKMRVYGFISAGHFTGIDWEGDVNFDFDVNGNEIRTTTGTQVGQYIGVGPGIGVEFHFNRHFALFIDAPMSLIFDLNNGKLSNGARSIIASPIPNAGLTIYL